MACYTEQCDICQLCELLQCNYQKVSFTIFCNMIFWEKPLVIVWLAGGFLNFIIFNPYEKHVILSKNSKSNL